jgi:hypothetical protein
MSTARAWQMVKWLAGEAGIEKPISLWHKMALETLWAGPGAVIVQKLLGHVSLSTRRPSGMSITWSTSISASGHSPRTERAQDKMHFLEVVPAARLRVIPMRASWVLGALVLRLL